MQNLSLRPVTVLVLLALPFASVLAEDLVITKSNENWITPFHGDNYYRYLHSNIDLIHNQTDHPLITTPKVGSSVTVSLNSINAAPPPSGLTYANITSATNKITQPLWDATISVTAKQKITLVGGGSDDFNNSQIKGNVLLGGVANITLKAEEISLTNPGNKASHSIATINSKNSTLDINTKKSLTITGNIYNGLLTESQPQENIIVAKTANNRVNLNEAPDISSKATTKITGNISTLNCTTNPPSIAFNITVAPWTVRSSSYEIGLFARARTRRALNTATNPQESWRGNSIHATFISKDSYLSGNVTDYYKNFGTQDRGTPSKYEDITPQDNEGTFLTFKDSSYWNMEGKTNRLKQITLQTNSKLIFNENTDFQTLQVDGNFIGDQPIDQGADTPQNYSTIIMKIDGSKNQNNSDLLLIKGTHEGTNTIQPKFIGDEKDKAAGTVLVRVNNEKGEFNLLDPDHETEAFHYILKKEDETESSEYHHKWVLVGIEPKNSSLQENAIELNQINYDILRTHDTTLRERLGHIRYKQPGKGAWIRLDGFHRYTSDFSDRMTGITIGADKRRDNGNLFGAFFHYGFGKSKLYSGSSNNKLISIGAYYTRFNEKQRYLDLLAEIGRYSHALNLNTEKNWTANHDTHHWMGHVAVEVGERFINKKNLFIEPRARFTLGWLNSSTFNTNTGAEVSLKNRWSAVGRLGLQLGYRPKEDKYINLTADVLHDFGQTNGDIRITKNEKTTFAPWSLRRTWYEVGASLSWDFNPKYRLYGDIKYGFKTGYDRNWRWHIGVIRWFE